MRVMVMVRATKESEAGALPTEIRRVYEAEDFGEEFTPALRAQEAQLRAQSANKR